MSRPKSDSRRKAILDAAWRVCAERGVSNAPTSAISRMAGVAEGTLFTYFKTKHELFDELYMELRRDFDGELQGFPHGADARTRLRFVWDTFLNTGIREPKRLAVLRELRATGRLLKPDEKPGIAVLGVLSATQEAVEGGAFREAPLEYLVLLLRGHAEATIEFILAHPEKEQQCREVGFEWVWKGLTKKKENREPRSG